jgi:hypothetical protein
VLEPPLDAPTPRPASIPSSPRSAAVLEPDEEFLDLPDELRLEGPSVTPAEPPDPVVPRAAAPGPAESDAQDVLQRLEALEGLEDLPPLEAPAPSGGRRSPTPRPRTLPQGVAPLEILPDDPDGAITGSLDPLPQRGARPGPVVDEESDDEVDDFVPPPEPQRRGLLGRILPGGARGARAGEDLQNRRDDEPADAVADAQLKRQIDRAIRAAAGDRVRNHEIMVRGRQVWIRAQAERFWQRRGVRKTLESMPILAGYEVRIDVQ